MRTPNAIDAASGELPVACRWLEGALATAAPGAQILNAFAVGAVHRADALASEDNRAALEWASLAVRALELFAALNDDVGSRMTGANVRARMVVRFGADESHEVLQLDRIWAWPRQLTAGIEPASALMRAVAAKASISSEAPNVDDLRFLRRIKNALGVVEWLGTVGVETPRDLKPWLDTRSSLP